MKHTAYIKTILFTAFFAGLTGSSCKKSFIDLYPVSQGTADQFYKSETDFVNAINAGYSVLQREGLYYREHLFADVTTDDATTVSGACVTGYCDFDNFQVAPSGTGAADRLNARWNDAYNGISRVNAILGRIDAVSMTEAVKTRVTGEAKYLRALFYVELARTFGDVPLVLEELTPADAYAYGREPVANVYAQAAKDLTDAAELLPASYSGADIGRATSGAADALLGEVYLTLKKYDLAETALAKTVAGPYELLADYASVFDPANANNAEIVFAVRYRKGDGEGSPFSSLYAPENSGTAVASGPLGYIVPTQDLRDAFEPGDARLPVSVATFVYPDGSTRLYTRKFVDPAGAYLDGSCDWIIHRYSDVLLMYAEALNEQHKTAQAEPYLKQVRDRAMLSTASGMTEEELRLAIEKERRVELCFEGHRWWDLVRTGRAQPVLNAYFSSNHIMAGGQLVQVKDYQTVFPVPQTQIDVNPDRITQNPGY